jgi:hypothetical protein
MKKTTDYYNNLLEKNKNCVEVVGSNPIYLLLTVSLTSFSMCTVYQVICISVESYYNHNCYLNGCLCNVCMMLVI